MTISPLAASPTDCILCYLVDGSIRSPEAKNIGVLLCLTSSFYLIRKKWCQKENCHLILAQAYNLGGCNQVPRAYKYRGQDFYHSCNRSCLILLHIHKKVGSKSAKSRYGLLITNGRKWELLRRKKAFLCGRQCLSLHLVLCSKQHNTTEK